jgi:hypothetical protein
MGVTIAEVNQSFGMISRRATQLTTAVNAIRKGDFGSLTGALGLSYKDERARRVWTNAGPKARVRDSSSHLLEYTFGWVPMVNDVISAAKVISSTPETLSVRGRRQDRVTIVEGPNPGPYSYFHTDINVIRKIQIGGVVSITNPNLDLANRMGLANPVQLAWQVIPYSFLVDTFFNVSQFLGRFSAMYGRTFTEGYCSGSAEAISQGEIRTMDGGTLVDSLSLRSVGKQFSRRAPFLLPIPTALPEFKLPVSNLLGRATTSVALLLQRLK